MGPRIPAYSVLPVYKKAGFILHDFEGFSLFLSSQSLIIIIIYLFGFFISCYG